MQTLAEHAKLHNTLELMYNIKPNNITAAKHH